ncbi:hypothetical protein E6H16_02750 [Candidatus Bathyarchaeota archaeon]|nr:MAG: hypothetical protein E6H16_02750 [Candidatus Bathyarchaeota archaeon]
MAQAQGYARPRPKIETLVDLIFGLSLSIGAVALITVSAPSSTAEINRRLLAFIFTASFLITNWMVYTYQMSVLPVETNFVIYMNVVMLILVATVPYLLYNVEFANPSLTPQEYSVIQDYASSLFAVDLAAILAILASFSHIISIEEKRLVAPALAKSFRQSRNVQAILSVIVLISLAPVFWDLSIFGVQLRLYIWAIPIIVYWIRRSVQSR